MAMLSVFELLKILAKRLWCKDEQGARNAATSLITKRFFTNSLEI
jgi:hypothetical protein